MWGYAGVHVGVTCWDSPWEGYRVEEVAEGGLTAGVVGVRQEDTLLWQLGCQWTSEYEK